MVCKKRKRKSNSMFLWCKGSRDPKYVLSPEGRNFLQSLPNFRGSSYIADVEYLTVPGDDLDFWKKLFTERLFPYWDPEGGPFSFMKRATAQYITLYRVHKIDVAIERDDLRIYRIGAEIKNREKLNAIRQSKRTLVIHDEEFDRIKNRIGGDYK